MKHSMVTKCIDSEQVRNSLVKLRENILDAVNINSKDDITTLRADDLNYWTVELRRLIQFFV